MGNNSWFYFILLSLVAAIGLGNIWIYPYYSYKYTGLFFISYLISLFALGIPLLMLEFSIGQYFNKNLVDSFASIKKWFSGIGWLMVFNSFIVMSYYAVIFSWHIIYFFVSLGLQWKNDPKGYFINKILQSSDGFTNFTQFSLPVFIGLILAWVIIFFCVRYGFESIKKIILITFPIFVFLMFLFLLYSLNLDNALAGVHSLLRPRFRGLLSLNVWIDSVSLVIVSLGISFGVMSAFARKIEKGFLFGNSIVVIIFEMLINIAIGFILFSILGFLSMKQGISLDRLVFSDFSFAFTILNQSFPFFYKPTLFSFLFFLFLSLFFIFGAVSLAYAISDVLIHKFKTKHRNVAVIVAGFGFLVGFLFIIKPGFYILDIVSHFIYYNILIAIFLEVLAVGWFFESQKISEYINANSKIKIGGIWRIFVRYLIPPVLLLLLFIRLKSDFLLKYKAYPLWAIIIFGVGTVFTPLILSFLMPQKILDK